MSFKGKVLRIVPDQAGKGGSKTALTTFEVNLDTRKVHNLMVYLGRWRNVPMAQDYGLHASPDTASTISLHNYLSYSTTDPTARGTSVILGHTVASSTGTHLIFNFTKGFSLRSALGAPCTPAVFVNVKNRCFICWGGAANFIDSDPAVLFSDQSKIYDIGVNPPATPPTYTLSGFDDYNNTALWAISYTTGSNKINGLPIFPTVAPIFSSSIKAVRIGGVGGTVYQVQSPGYVDTFTPGGPVTCTGTIATNQLTIVSYHFPPNGDWNGLLLFISDGGNSETWYIASYVYSGADTTVTLSGNLAHSHAAKPYTVTGEQLVLTLPVEETTALKVGIIRIFSGALSWIGNGPQYAYAYYDPVTGHVSNASPILQITERDQAGVNIELTNLIPSVADDQFRFTQIIIFRTLLAGGAVLFPISTAYDPETFEHVTNSGAPSFYIDANPDSLLLVAGGLQAPIVTNAKPPIATHMAYWDGRLWMIPTSDPSAVIFSGDFIQIPFGVAEESFPSGNQLRIPSDDGRGVGMRLIGSDLVITTERYSYTVQGVGPQYYRLARLGAAQFGVGDYQMAEFPGDTAENQSALLYLGRDARLYLMAPGYGNVSVSDPVADQFQEQIAVDDTNYALSRVHYFTAPNQRLALVSLPNNVQMYDFDRKIWIDCNPNTSIADIARPQSFCTIYGGSRPVDLIYGFEGTIYSWMRNEPGQAGCVASEIELGVFDFGNKKRKQLNFIRIYTTAPTILFLVYPDETAEPYQMYAVVEPDPLNSIYAPSDAPVDDPDAKELVAFPLATVSSDDLGTATLSFHRIRIKMVPPGTGDQFDYYAIDIGYTELETGDDTAL